MCLIDEWKHAWKLLSIQANTVGLGIVGAYAALPEEFKSAIPAKYVLAAAGVTFLLGLVGRLVKQPDALPPKDEAPK